ncbi:unnamed protein product [Mytilus edulis]|uniref:Uncharacterized protein n=1 Tax=Mytilus edulis TaxID=6550 RepID=A0A8S3U3F4_MYTED|nr:unnamed protein product [Mytilus edulis]
MLNHLKLKHPNDFSETPEKVKQSSVLDFVQTPRSRRFSSTQSELITNSIVDMIILDYLPIRIVEGKGFSKLMSIIAPEFKIPSRNTIKSRIEKSYSDKKESLIKELNLIDSVSLTSDTWTSNATKSFLTVQNITLTKTGIYSQIFALNHAWEIPAIAKLTSRARKLVGHFKHSTTITAEMRKRQKLFGLRQNELIQDVVTRWNSTQLMIERLCEQRRVITDVMLDTTVTKKCDTHMLLKDHEWDYLVEISAVLKQMSHVTTYMCLEKDVSASVMLPIVNGLLKKHLKNSEEDSALAHKMKASISEELITRFKPYDIETASTQHALASLLDPRHRTLNFFSPEQKKVAIEMLESKLDDVPLKPAVKTS